MEVLFIFIGVPIAVILLLILIALGVRTVQQWERGVVLRLGKYLGVRDPGLTFIVPIVDEMRKMDLRVVTFDVPAQECITRDTVTVKVNAVVYFQVFNPVDALIKVQDHIQATSLISQTTLRSVIGQHELEALLAERDKLNATLRQIIDAQTDPWGVKVSLVEIKDVELPEGMQRAMAAQAEAERERRAKITHADGEVQAASRLAEAGRIIAAEPTALQLRYLQVLTQIATEKTSTMIFPIPLDIVSAFLNRRSATPPPPTPPQAAPAAPPAGAQTP